MNEKKRLEFQQNMISRQSKQIESLKLQIENLELELQEKNELINSIEPLRNELAQSVSNSKKYEKEYKELISEIRKMKEIMNQTVYKGRWWLVKLIIK